MAITEHYSLLRIAFSQYSSLEGHFPISAAFRHKLHQRAQLDAPTQNRFIRGSSLRDKILLAQSELRSHRICNPSKGRILRHLGHLLGASSPEAFQEERSEGLSYNHILLPLVDSSPYLSEGSRQTITTATAMAKQHGADITVVVIDKDEREKATDHEIRIKNIRWHLEEGGFEEFGLLERFGEGTMPAAMVGEVADDLGIDIVVLSMEALHSKSIDANLLAEFVPCPVLLLPL